MPNQLLKQLITVYLADEAPGVVVVVRDIRRVFGKQVTDDLIDGVIPFFTQRAVYGCEQCFHLLIGFIGNDNTIKFVVPDDTTEEMKAILPAVYGALSEKGYNPINQIVGYLLSEDPTYITNYNNARSLICKLDRDELLQELVRHYLFE